jgi:hypothetical protein
MAGLAMSSQTAMSLMAVAEFALWTVLGLLFWARKLHLRFPAMGIYLALHVAAMPVLVFLFYGQPRHWLNDRCFYYYYFVYWAVYIASAVLLFFVCIEVFRSALSLFPGLQRLGTVAFRWAALVSVIVSLSTLPLEHPHILILNDIAFRLMRSVSIVELCLLAFLCLSMNALRLSVRDMAFGIALGLALISTNDFVNASFLSRNGSLTDAFQFLSESVILVVLGTWVAYAALPETAPQPVMLPAKSFLFRWDEIASALGHTGTQVAVRPASGFSLTDVEMAAEEAISRNLKSR